MNRTFGVAGIVFGIVVCAAFVVHTYGLHAQPQKLDKAETAPKHTLQTSGSATVRTKPDSVRLYFRVVTTEPTIEQARKNNTDQVKQVMEAIQKLKVKNLKMKSDDVSVNQVHEKKKEETELPKLIGYRITNDFTVLIENKNTEQLGAAAGQVLDTGLKNGANTVQQVHFFKKDLTNTKRTAMTQATEDAIENAKALAKGAGRKVQDILTIDSSPNYHGFSQGRLTNVAFPVGGGAALVVGDLEVTCTVQVTCVHN